MLKSIHSVGYNAVADSILVSSFVGLQSFGRQDVWATDVWATNFFPNVHLGDTKLNVWATMTSRLGDKSKSTGQSRCQCYYRQRQS